MIGISFEQVVVLLLLALILFGPERLPEVAEKLGRWVAKLRQASSEMTQHYQDSLKIQEPRLLPKKSVCPHCSHQLEHDFTFCPNCGHRLKENPYPEQPLAS